MEKNKLPKTIKVESFNRTMLDGFPAMKIVDQKGHVYFLTRDRKEDGSRSKKWTLRAQDQSVEGTRKYKSLMEFLNDSKVTDEAFVMREEV